jgi:hypothetical protein
MFEEQRLEHEFLVTGLKYPFYLRAVIVALRQTFELFWQPWVELSLAQGNCSE